ncbi:uncharacterized protein PV07_09232 [Cladophialophora immunda]|uniref:Uncharacterized protein n=1 Tax=Cladophialophora immunda TaxID=569365 RepID=A0A0D2C6J2_9EURO|nr:uncharacterized protein PV07_09232 [Cladophialophora immunda]KIW26105.1 hypothetical protein PV07_09232 [Cladophialophora immunda]
MRIPVMDKLNVTRALPASIFVASDQAIPDGALMIHNAVLVWPAEILVHQGPIAFAVPKEIYIGGSQFDNTQYAKASQGGKYDCMVGRFDCDISALTTGPDHWHRISRVRSDLCPTMLELSTYRPFSERKPAFLWIESVIPCTRFLSKSSAASLPEEHQ